MKKSLLIVLSLSFILAIVSLSACSAGWKKGKDTNVKTAHSEDSRNPILKDVSSVDYRWKMSIVKQSSAAITLEFTVHEGKSDYKAVVNGIVNECVLPSGTVLWEGPIDGTILINGNRIPIICGFVKLASDDNIHVSVTFQSTVCGGSSLPVIMSFGEGVITEEINQELQMNGN